MRPPLSRYIALARRRTMALMSRRGPLLERSRLAVDLRDRGGDDARARAGARSVASLDARKDAARLRPPSAIARRIPARQRDAATRVDHTVPARHLLWRLLGHGRAHDARAPRFRAGANRPPGDPRRGGHTRVAGGGPLDRPPRRLSHRHGRRVPGARGLRRVRVRSLVGRRGDRGRNAAGKNARSVTASSAPRPSGPGRSGGSRKSDRTPSGNLPRRRARC